MKRTLIAGLICAFLSAALIVFLYESKIIQVNEDPRLTPQQKEASQDTQDPQPSSATTPTSAAALSQAAPAPDASREELLRRDAALRQEIARLQAELQATKTEDEDPTSKPEPEAPWFEASPEQLKEMAKDCRLSWDVPPGLDLSEAADLAEQNGATPEETEALKRIATSVNRRYEKELRALFLEATGTAASEDLSPDPMIQEIEAKSSPDDLAMAYYLITQERAGLKAPPANLSSRPAVERSLRLQANLGNDFERALAEQIGAARAHTFRGRSWPRSITSSGGCDGLNEKP